MNSRLLSISDDFSFNSCVFAETQSSANRHPSHEPLKIPNTHINTRCKLPLFTVKTVNHSLSFYACQIFR